MNGAGQMAREILQLEQQATAVQPLLAVITTLAVTHGRKKGDGFEYRLNKAAQSKADGQTVEVKQLKSGVLVITTKATQ